MPPRQARWSWVATITLVATSFTGGVFFAGVARARPGDQGPFAVVEQMARVLTIVENDYVDPVERDKLLAGAIKGMVAELDPHSAYLPPEENALFQSETEGKFGGVGLEVELRDERVVIVAPIEGSPADRAGLLPGDRVVAIDGEPVRGVGLDKLVKKMRGDPGSKVTLSVMGPRDERPKMVTLVREIIKVNSVVGVRMSGDVAYLRVKQFQGSTHEEFLRVIARIRSGPRPLAGVLLDLRNNPGGLVDQATGIADEFLASGVIYSTRRRGKIVDEVTASRGGALVDLPVVVLVNEFSASASELVAGALQDHKRATVVGAVTFGKGSVQTIMDLGNGSGMKLTTQRYTTPHGRVIQAAGITPDLIVDQATPLPAGLRAPRERDLENHLPPHENIPARPAPPPAPASSVAEPTDPEAGVARVPPEDPLKSHDKALIAGYRALLEKMKK